MGWDCWVCDGLVEITVEKWEGGGEGLGVGGE